MYVEVRLLESTGAQIITSTEFLYSVKWYYHFNLILFIPTPFYSPFSQNFGSVKDAKEKRAVEESAPKHLLLADVQWPGVWQFGICIGEQSMIPALREASLMPLEYFPGQTSLPR